MHMDLDVFGLQYGCTIYSALHTYCNSKDKIALLAVESRHLQLLLKDEYDTKLQNVIFYN